LRSRPSSPKAGKKNGGVIIPRRGLKGEEMSEQPELPVESSEEKKFWGKVPKQDEICSIFKRSKTNKGRQEKKGCLAYKGVWGRKIRRTEARASRRLRKKHVKGKTSLVEGLGAISVGSGMEKKWRHIIHTGSEVV